MCKCADGYEKSGSNGRNCKYLQSDGTTGADLVYSNRYYLRNISLSSGYANLIMQGFAAARGIAYDYVEQNFYVLDAGTGELHKIKVNTSLPNVAVSSEV